MMAEKKYFTVEEANGLLPQLKLIVETLQQRRQRLQDLRATAEMLGRKATGNGGGGTASTALFEHSAALVQGLARLESLGVLLKDIDRGLLDFPHWRDGREVYLCWEKGEERINYWHDIDSGYGGRQPL